METLERGSIIKMVSPEGKIKLGLVEEVTDTEVKVLEEWYSLDEFDITLLGLDDRVAQAETV